MRPNFKSHHEEAILNEIFYGQCYTFKARKMRRNNLKAKAKSIIGTSMFYCAWNGPQLL